MRKVKTTLIVLSSLLACYSCKKETSIDEVSIAEEIYNTPIPLKVGNYWKYETSYVSYSHQEEKMINKSHGVHKITVVDDTVINDTEFFLIDGSFTALQPPREEENLSLSINCKDGIVSSEDFDALIYLSSDFNTVNNYGFSILDDFTKFRYEISTTDTSFNINDTEILNPLINKRYLTYITSSGDVEVIQPIQEVIIDEKIGVISVTSRYAGIADQTDLPNKNDRFEKKLIAYNIQ